jgi:hypothetical protein
MTINQAQKFCQERKECLGFTFGGPAGEPPLDVPLEIFFKSSSEWHAGPGWHTFTKNFVVTEVASEAVGPKIISVVSGAGRLSISEAAQPAVQKPKALAAPIKDNSGCTLIGSGRGGVEEMQQLLDDGEVWFGLLKFVVGQGSFARAKYIFVHWTGQNCGGVKRGRTNAKKGAALSKVGGSHAEIIFQDRSECTLDNIFEQLQGCFISDEDIGAASFSIAQMKADYQQMIDINSTKVISKVAKKPENRPTAMEMPHVPSAEQCFAAVREPLGPFNWVLFGANASKLQLINAGGGSVVQMARYLKDDQVCFGLLRLGFGGSNMRRTKWVFVFWSGQNMSMVKRGQANAAESAMKEKLRPFNLSLVYHNTSDFTLKKLVARVQKSIVVDGGGETGENSDGFTVDAFMDALKEEAAVRVFRVRSCSH